MALATDGRMSGAAGAVPAAIRVTPEWVGGGTLALAGAGEGAVACMRWTTST